MVTDTMATSAAAAREPFTLVTRVTSPFMGPHQTLVVSDEGECELLLATLQRELQIIRDKLEEAALQQNEGTAMNSIHGQLHNPSTSSAATTSSGEITTFKQLTKKSPLLRKRVDATKKREISYTQQQQEHYLNIIKKKERQLIESSNQYKKLMEAHILQQIKKLEENSGRLAKKLHQRVEKEKVNRLRKLQPIKPQENKPEVATNRKKGKYPLYKSSYYETVREEERLRKYGMRNPLLSPPREQTAKQKSSSQQLVPIIRNTGTYNRVGEERGGPSGDASNSWAITGAKTVTDMPPTSKPIVIAPSKPPEFIPIKRIFGDDCLEEEARLNAHRQTVREQVVNRHKLSMMYQKAQIYRRIMDGRISSDWDLVDTFTPINSAHQLYPHSEEPISSASQLTRFIDQSKHDKAESTISTDDKDPSPLHSTAHTPSPLPLTPFSVPLTMEQLLTDTNTNIKEAQKSSSLWINHR